MVEKKAETPMQILSVTVKYSVVKDHQAGGTIVVADLDPGDIVDCIVTIDGLFKEAMIHNASVGFGTLHIPFQFQEGEKLVLRVYVDNIQREEHRNWAGVHLVLMGDQVAATHVRRCNLTLEDHTS